MILKFNGYRSSFLILLHTPHSNTLTLSKFLFNEVGDGSLVVAVDMGIPYQWTTSRLPIEA